MHKMADADVSVAATRAGGLRERVGAYVGLTKPRIIELLIVTTIPTMFLAADGVPPLSLLFFTLVGGTLSAGGANVFNSVYDRDIDERMHRTRRRPMVRHRVTTRNAYLFGLALAVVSTLLLGFGANWLSAGLSVLAILYYVIVYTIWLKRRTPQNIVWGGVAGCFPPLIGWTAVTNSIALPPLILFAVVFLWTPAHTWALGLRYRDDYARADVPMLPVVADAPVVTRQILGYAALTAVVALTLWPAAGTGWLYPVVAVLAGGWMVVEAVRLKRRADAGLTGAPLNPMRLFHTSNSYLALVAAAAALDPLLF
jgi:protoheme IX farnesyltransferase